MQLDNFRKQKLRMRPLSPENSTVVVVPESFAAAVSRIVEKKSIDYSSDCE